MKIKLVIILCFILSANQALAIGIGAKPSSLDVNLAVGQRKEANITVYNLSEEAGIFSVSPDDLNDWIKVEPNNFRLEAGENKQVGIKILAKEEGIKAINLSVSATPLEHQNFSINPGIKIPLRLSISENLQGRGKLLLASILETFQQSSMKLSGGIFAFLLIIFLLLKLFRKRRKVFSPPENLPVEI